MPTKEKEATAVGAGLTERQAAALDVVRARQRRAGPTVREIAKALGVSGQAAQNHVDALREKGIAAPESGDGVVLVDASAAVAAPKKSAPDRRNRAGVVDMFKRAPILKPKGNLL